MKLWTIQPLSVWNKLTKDGIHHCDGRYVMRDLIPGYRWLAAEMCQRVGTPPSNCLYPIWAWHTHEWKHQRPNLRRHEFWYSKPNWTCIELDIPEDKVLLTDELDWHDVLNNRIHTASDISADEWEAIYNRWEALPTKDKVREKLDSWQSILVSPEEASQHEYVQATFWELRMEDVLHVWHYKGLLPDRERCWGMRNRTTRESVA